MTRVSFLLGRIWASYFSEEEEKEEEGGRRRRKKREEEKEKKREEEQEERRRRRRSRGRHVKSLPLRGHRLCGHPVLWYYLQVCEEVLQRKDVPVTLCHAELIAPTFQGDAGLGVLCGGINDLSCGQFREPCHLSQGRGGGGESSSVGAAQAALTWFCPSEQKCPLI